MHVGVRTSPPTYRDAYIKKFYKTSPTTRKAKNGRLVVTKEPQHASHGILEDQLTKSQKQKIKVSGMHVGVRASPPTYRDAYVKGLYQTPQIYIRIYKYACAIKKEKIYN